ncbi:PIN domain-containing protein [Bacillus thuringiensis]|uniref:PIN domain-containing protein n=1 Tax=Bacillus thuringiensis TaxID=1428 RepID=UPI000BFB2D25|nr:PIN domain-containing protein [Bacillus thuringiensis]PGK33916.1 hypothetical protein CN908_28890 [Bacillus thuringiensis]
MTYIYPNNEFKTIWNSNPLIIIDTNVILNLYRYSPDTSNHILKVLNSIPKHQLWIPAQVLEEYKQNHDNVRNLARNKYKEVTSEINRIISNAENSFFKQFTRFNKLSFPKVQELSKDTNQAITIMRAASQKYAEEIKNEIKKNKLMIEEDNVKTFVDDLISLGRVGEPFSISNLLKIFTEGELRYKYEIPPGYKDSYKDNRKKFGDLILWKQILEQAQRVQEPIIFITLDVKEDWWILDDKNTPVRPRDELLMEFKEYSKKPLAIMQVSDFIEKTSLIIDMVDYKTNLELNSTEYGMECIRDKDWDDILNENQLTEYLIQSEALIDSFNRVPFDIEIEETFDPVIEVNSVNIIQNDVVMEGSFEAEIGILITETYSENYSCESYAYITFIGSISIEFEADFDVEKDPIVRDTITIAIGGFEVSKCDVEHNAERNIPDEDRCRDCSNPNASYHTKMYNEAVCERCKDNYEVCPECGFLFEYGTLLGSNCKSCEINFSLYS